MKNKIVIWDLFGGSQNSLFKAVSYMRNKNKYEIHTFDIVDEKYHPNQHKVDLSDLDEFEKYVFENNIPKPDIICASPLCQSFSIIMNCGKGERIGIKKTDYGFAIRTEEEIAELLKGNKFIKSTPQDIRERAVLGWRLLVNTLRILEKYKPLAFYIENPQTSLMWDVIDYLLKSDNYGWLNRYQYQLNKADYNSYDLSYTQKKTIFFSLYHLSLKEYNIVGNVEKPKGAKLLGNSYNETGERVKIPALLLIDIINQFTNIIETDWKYV